MFLYPHGAQLGLERFTHVVAVGVGLDDLVNLIRKVIWPLLQHHKVMLGHHMPLELAFHLVKVARGHVRVIVPQRHEVEPGTVRLERHCHVAPAYILLPLALGLSLGERTLEHTHPVLDTALQHLPAQLSEAHRPATTQLLQLIFHFQLQPRRADLGEIAYRLFDRFIRQVLALCGVQQFIQHALQVLLAEIRHRRGFNPPALVIGLEQQVHQAGQHGHHFYTGELGVRAGAIRVEYLLHFLIILAEVLALVARPLEFTKFSVSLVTLIF